MSDGKAAGDDGPRRFLIATAVSHYPHAPEWDRPGLVEARREMVELFTGKLGYEHVSDLGTNPTQGQLLRELREFCRSPERRADDILAVYIAGHGELLDNDEYVLLTSDTHPDDLYDALPPSTLARKILAGTKVRRLLLMLDTCFSGQGGNELLSAMAKLKNSWREKDAALAVITSAQPNELAQVGAFPELLTEAVTSLATAGYTPELLPLGAVVEATRNNPKRPGFQHIGWEIIGLTGDIPPFLPNAKHSNRLSHTDLALQRAAEWDEQSKRRDVEFRTRLLRRAMGHRDEERVGWWFSGRHRALGDITGWLAELLDERPALVVTGGPGSGKTAVLGLLAAVSAPEYRQTVPLSSLGLSPELLPPPRTIRTAVYAQNLTDQQVVRALAAALRLPLVEAVADLLNHLDAGPEPDRPAVVLIDGLDEAATPSTLCGEVLRPLTELAGTRLRLLLGTRPHLLAPLGLERADHVDLDSPRYADPQAVLVYTVRNLIDAHPESPYLACPSDLRLWVARAVATAAGHSFLVARITAGTLAATSTLPDPHDPGWRRSLPSVAADAMHRDLHQRFGEGAERILDLLRPLAYAEGQGLPWEDIWAPLASQVSGRRYTNEDLHQLRRDAGAYVVEAVEDGRSVYRLYHEAMAEYLRQGQDSRKAHRAVTTALRQAVPYHLDGSRHWGRAHPYTLRHLATHASLAGELDSLLPDTEYLVHADCDTLAGLLQKPGSDTARLHSAIYLASISVHRHLDPPGRRQVLALDTARFNVPTLLKAFNDKAAEGAWRPVGASGSQVSGHLRNAFTNHTGGVEAVACTRLNGRPVAVAGGRDGRLRVWDLLSGQPVGEPLTGHTGPVSAVSCTELDGRPVAVTGSKDRSVRVWDLATGRAVGEGRTDGFRAVTQLVCAELEGQPIAVSLQEGGTLQLWDLTTCRPMREPMPAGYGTSTLACVELDGRLVAVMSSSMSSGIRLWDLKKQEKLGGLAGGRRDGWIVSVASSQEDDDPFVVGSGQDGSLYLWGLWDLVMESRFGRPRLTGEYREQWQGHSDWTPAIACTVLNGRPVAVTGSHDTTVRIWDLATREQLGAPLKGHTSWVRSVACTTVSGHPVAVTGSSDDTVRVWELSPSQGVGRPMTGHTGEIRAMDLTEVNGDPVCVTGSLDTTLRVWDLATGLPVDEPVVPSGFGVRSVSCTTLGDQPVAVAGSIETSAQVWDLTMGRHARGAHVGTPLSGVLCTVLDGRPIVVGEVSDDSVWVGDLATGKPLYPPLHEPTDSVAVVACTVLDQRPIIVTESADRALRLWDAATSRCLGTIRLDPEPRCTACAVLGDRTVAVTGSDDLTVRLWDLATGQQVGPPMTGHTQAPRTITCAVLDGRPVAVTGSADNTVRIWDLQTHGCVAVIHLPGPGTALALHATGRLACAFGSDLAVFARQ